MSILTQQAAPTQQDRTDDGAAIADLNDAFAAQRKAFAADRNPDLNARAR